MSREEILMRVRSKPRTYAKTPAECHIMGCQLNEFTPAEQAEILLWALEREQQRNAEYRQTIDAMLQLMRPAAVRSDPLVQPEGETQDAVPERER